MAETKSSGRMRLGFYSVNVLTVFFIIALCYVFLLLGNSLLSGLGGDVIHYDLQGRPYITKYNGVSEGAWLAFFLGMLFIFAKIIVVALIIGRIDKWFPALGRSLCFRKNTRHRFLMLLDARTGGAEISAGLLASLALAAALIYGVSSFLMMRFGPMYTKSNFSFVFWMLNTGDVMSVSAFMFSFFTLRKSLKSIIAFVITLAVVLVTNQFAIRRTLQWLLSGARAIDYIPLYILVFTALSVVLFIIVTLLKNYKIMPAVCVILIILMHVYYKLIYGYGWLSLGAAYATGVLAGPVTMIWITVQLSNRLDFCYEPHKY